MLYRNPFDYVVSYYSFCFSKRNIKYTPLDGEISRIVHEYISQYLQQKKLLKRKNTIKISYEEIVTNPEITFSKIISFLELPLEPALVKKAIDYSSVEKVQQHERDRKAVIVGENMKSKSSFINSGKIGQWKTQLTKKQIRYITEQLEANGISLDAFTLE